MKSNKGLGTKPEIVLARLLRRKMLRSKLPGSPDFVYRKARLAVFVHGCWWHRCPKEDFRLPKTHTAFWKRKFARNMERDRLNREELESTGWKVIEIWEHEIRVNPRVCANNVLAVVRARAKVQAVD